MTCRQLLYDHVSMNVSESRRMAALEAKVIRQAAEHGQLRESVHRLTHENIVLRLERDEAYAERDDLRIDAASARAELAEVRAELQLTRQQHADTKWQLGDLVNAVAHSDERLRALVRREFGASSERLIADRTYIPEILAALNEEETTVALTPPDTAAAPETSMTAAVVPVTGRRRRPANAGGRKPLPADIERRHRDYIPPSDHPALRHALSHDTIGSTTLERWHVGKTDLHIECIHCPVVQLTLREGISTQQTLSPPSVIERGQVSDALLVQSAVDRVVDHLPIHRQEQRALRIGVHIPRAKLCRWHMALATFLTGVADAIFDDIIACDVIGIDDSVHRRLVPDRRVCQQSRIWAVTAPAGTYYMFSPTREGHWICDLLTDYSGVVMGDAYAGHNGLLSRADIIAIFCWAHARRKFFECTDRQRREIMLALIAELYAIEKEIASLPPAQRVFVRSARAKPVLARIRTQLEAWQADLRVLPKSGIGRAVAYTLKLWPGLEAYVAIGSAPIDNNACERDMRSAAMFRKNSLFSASEAGAESYATLMTVCRSAILHHLDPVAYLCDIIDDIHFDRRPLSELTPQAYARRLKAASEARS
jgi:transposase